MEEYKAKARGAALGCSANQSSATAGIVSSEGVLPAPTSKVSSKESWTTEAKSSGKKYAMMCHPWDLNFRGGSCPNIDPLSPLRYNSEKAQEESMYAEVFYSVLDTAEHHRMVELRLGKYKTLVSSSFALCCIREADMCKFSNGMTDQRNNTTNRIKNYGHLVFENFDSKVFTNRGPNAWNGHVKNYPSIHVIMGRKPDGSFDRQPPLLYEDCNPSNVRTIFRNHALPKVRIYPPSFNILILTVNLLVASTAHPTWP